ncbi:MAG: hypothetical protein RJB38_468 [Pseudomonadota bacterium]|jgi:DNA-binding transcriptional LysR family regulator
MDLDLLDTFLLIIESGSLARAALIKRVQKSTISRQLSLLENRCGVALLHRTTRRIALTAEGRRLLESIQAPLSELRRTHPSTLFEARKGPEGILRGRLKLTAPIALGEALLAPLLAQFIKNHPELDIQVHLSDEVLDLVAEGFDLAIRSGMPEQQSLKMLSLGRNRFGLFAGPELASQFPQVRKGSGTHGQKQDPRNLNNSVPCIEYWPDDEAMTWDLHQGHRKVKVKLDRPIRVNSLHLARSLCQESAGVALLPEFFCSEAIAEGRLVRILPEWSTSFSRISAVFPGHRMTSPVVQAFLPLLKASLGGKITSSGSE